MEANEVDVNYPQPTGQEDGTVGSIANGIMDMLDNTAPNDSGVVEPKPAETSASTEEDGKERFLVPNQPLSQTSTSSSGGDRTRG